MSATDSLPVVLLTPYYASGTVDRQRELDLCLRENVQCRAISRIILVVDDGSTPPIESPKISVMQVSRKPTYQQWISISTKLGYPHISVLANSDIYFDDTASNFETCLVDDRSFVALSRFDRIGNELKPHLNPHWSQDVWAIRHPLDLPKALFDAINIPLGVPRCDNRIAFLFKIHGWRIMNPFGVIMAGHAHESQIRGYDKLTDSTIIGGVAYVHPCSLGGISDIDVDVWTLDDAQIKSVKLNRSLVRRRARPHHRPIMTKRVGQVRDALSYRLKHTHRWVKALISPTPSQRSDARTPDAVRPVLDVMVPIKRRSEGRKDPHYWQYPCFTEKQAFENHDTIPVGRNVDERGGTIHTYLALPWATYIDVRAPIAEVLATVREEVDRNRSAARQQGYELRVHTVCQHYAWHRIKDQFTRAGVTDLHLAHCTTGLLAESSDALRFHSWPLFAPNIENSLRSRGIQVGVPPEKKAYLASFIGSHMEHYRSETRPALHRAAVADGGADIFVELTSVWHFNRAVYDEQVKGDVLSASIQIQQLKAAERYNRLLSNTVFSLCPDGAGPNTLRVWESLAVGSIPVVISDDWAPPKLNGRDLTDACLFVQSSEIPGLFDRLRAIPDAEIAERMRACFDCYFAARSMTSFATHDFEQIANAIQVETAVSNFVEVAP